MGDESDNATSYAEVLDNKRNPTRTAEYIELDDIVGPISLSRRRALASLFGFSLPSKAFGNVDTEPATEKLGVRIQPLVRNIVGSISGVSIEFKRCNVAVITNASNIDTLAVYYANSEGERLAVYDIAPTTSKNGDSLVVTYNATQDRSIIGAKDQKSLVCIVGETNRAWTTKTNPNDACLPSGFNTSPSAWFTVPETPTINEPVTFTSTATDPDLPIDRLHYEWDFNSDGMYETTGKTATYTHTEGSEVTVRHRVTDDFGTSDIATKTILVSLEEVAKLTPSDAQADEGFGYSVALDGDTAFVGEPREDVMTGAADVFTRSDSSWTQQAKLTASDAKEREWFGIAVSVDGDTAAIGARHEGEEDTGAVYIFTRSGSSWIQQAKLTPSDPVQRQWFGTDVSVDGDFALVGSYKYEPVSVFLRSSSSWTKQAELVKGYGGKVSLDGNTALLGARRDGTGGVFAGAAYVFTRSGSSWTRQTKLTPSDPQNYGRFGFSVAVDGDTALLGAIGDDTRGEDAGAAYVFTRSGSSWTQQAKLIASDGQPDDEFGFSVDVDGDTALIGALQGDGRAEDAGVVYRFTRSDMSWGQQDKFIASDGQSYDGLGLSVSMDGDTNLVGAPREDEIGDGAGAAYVFK